MIAIIPLLKMALPGIVLASAVGIGVYMIQERGREAERKVCHARETKAQLDYQTKLNAKQRELSRREAAHLATLAEVERSKNAQIEKLNTDVSRLADRGLYIAAPKCPTATGAGLSKARDPGPASSPAGRIRLSSTDERRLIALAGDAQRVVQQYEACRRTLSNLAVIQN